MLGAVPTPLTRPVPSSRKRLDASDVLERVLPKPGTRRFFSRSERKRGCSMTILIADSDDEFATLLTYWLHRHGQIPLLAQDWRTTLQLWRTHCPDVVVVDLALLETGRTAFCRLLRATGRGRILVLTDPRSLDEEENALEQGADDFLAKPISMRQGSAPIDALARRIQ